MPKFKILYVNGTVHIGGAEVSLINLIRKMNRDLFAPVAAVPSGGRLFDRLNKLDMEVRILKLNEFCRHRWFSFLTATFKLSSLIRKEGINLVHANSIYIAEQSLFAAKLAGVPCVCHVRDLVPVLGAGMVRSAAFAKMNLLIAISDAVKMDLVEKLRVPEGKVIRVYNGVDTEEFHPDISGENFKEEFKLGSKGVIGMAGRLSPEKGHEIFLRAGSQIIRDRDDIRLLIAGSSELGPEGYRERLGELAEELGIKDKVVFTGFREDLPQVMAAMDIVVVPSSAEPFGRVIIEAMASGKPVIAANSGGAPELISEESGLIVEPRDLKGLKEAMSCLLQDKVRSHEIGRAARKRAVNCFGIEKHVLEVEDLYSHILSNR